MSTELNLFDMPGAPERPLDYILSPEDIMYVQDLKMHFPVTKGLLKRQVGAVKAVDGVTFNIKRGQTLGIVGESGSGKSTIGNCLLRNITPTGGHVYYEGHDMKDLNPRSLQRMRKNIQMITQDPFASLDPRMTILAVVSEGGKIHKLLRMKAALPPPAHTPALPTSDDRYSHPLHPYTQALISAAPIPDPVVDRARERILLEGEIPSPINPPKGCNFCTRCKYADERCRTEEPQMVDVGNNHKVACHRVTGV